MAASCLSCWLQEGLRLKDLTDGNDGNLPLVDLTDLTQFPSGDDDDKRTVQRAFKANHVEHMIRELLETVRRLEANQLPKHAATSFSAAAAAQRRDGTVTAHAIARLVQLRVDTQVSQVNDPRLQKISILLAAEPLDVKRLAQAYNLARAVRKGCPTKVEELCKNVCLLIRELLA